jgi:hypothetical protein
VFVHGFCLDMGTFHFQRRALDGEYRWSSTTSPARPVRPAPEGEYTLDELGGALAAVLDATCARPADRARRTLDGRHDDHGAGRAVPDLFVERVAGWSSSPPRPASSTR